MNKDLFSYKCHNCGGELKVNRLTCRDCGLSVNGLIELPRLARLNRKDREFIEIFILAAGSLKEAGRILGLSYPTVRHRLDRVIADVRELEREEQKERMGVIKQLERGEISAEQAARELAVKS